MNGLAIRTNNLQRGPRLNLGRSTSSEVEGSPASVLQRGPRLNLGRSLERVDVEVVVVGPSTRPQVEPGEKRGLLRVGSGGVPNPSTRPQVEPGEKRGGGRTLRAG